MKQYTNCSACHPEGNLLEGSGMMVLTQRRKDERKARKERFNVPIE